MALQKRTLTNIGAMAPEAYFVIENIRLISRSQMVFDVRGYYNGQKTDEGKRPYACFWAKTYTVDYDPAIDPWQQGYAFLKTLDDFRDTVDV